MKIGRGLLLALLLCTFAFAGETLTVETLLENAAKHDNQEVTVSGVATSLKQHLSIKGNSYFTFKLKGKEKVVKVYSFGKHEETLKDNSRVEVSGIFRKEKKIGDWLIKDEVDASAVKDKKFGVKVIQ